MRCGLILVGYAFGFRVLRDCVVGSFVYGYCIWCCDMPFGFVFAVFDFVLMGCFVDVVMVVNSVVVIRCITVGCHLCYFVLGLVVKASLCLLSLGVGC